ncbi:MAG TPA: hypothetical protein VF516_29145, partial [Kofleriaceae bacterium]
AAAGAQDPAKPGSADPAPDPKPAELAGAEAASDDPKPAGPQTADGKATDGKAADGKAANRRATDGKTADDKATSGKAADARTGEGRSSGRRSAGARDTNKRRGILAVDASPWSWVLVDVDPQYHETPTKFYLEPGVHTVKLVNDNSGRTRYAKVTIEPDKLSRLDVDMN